MLQRDAELGFGFAQVEDHRFAAELFDGNTGQVCALFQAVERGFDVGSHVVHQGHIGHYIPLALGPLLAGDFGQGVVDVDDKFAFGVGTSGLDDAGQINDTRGHWGILSCNLWLNFVNQYTVR